MQGLQLGFIGFVGFIGFIWVYRVCLGLFGFIWLYLGLFGFLRLLSNKRAKAEGFTQQPFAYPLEPPMLVNSNAVPAVPPSFSMFSTKRVYR